MQCSPVEISVLFHTENHLGGGAAGESCGNVPLPRRNPISGFYPSTAAHVNTLIFCSGKGPYTHLETQTVSPLANPLLAGFGKQISNPPPFTVPRLSPEPTKGERERERAGGFFL